MAFIHGGGGAGFHFIYTLEGGVTQFGNFRAKIDDSKLPPTDAKYDFSFGLGGGVGYGLSTTSDIYVSSDRRLRPAFAGDGDVRRARRDWGR